MKTREKILEIIQSRWPVHATEIAKHLKLEILHFDHQKKHVARINYHLKKLEREGLIYTKKVGQATVCWPIEIEKIRVIQEMLS
jgi:predicted ArsR family transcriptional regulator